MPDLHMWGRLDFFSIPVWFLLFPPLKLAPFPSSPYHFASQLNTLTAIQAVIVNINDTKVHNALVPLYD